MLKLIQLFTSAWRNKDTERKGKKKNTSSCSLHNIHQTKNKTKKNNKKKTKKLTHKYIDGHESKPAISIFRIFIIFS